MKKTIVCLVLTSLFITQALALPINFIDESNLNDSRPPITSAKPHLVYNLANRVHTVEQIIEKDGNLYILDRRPLSVEAYGISWRRWTWHLQMIHNKSLSGIVDLTEDRGYYVDQDDPYVARAIIKDAYITRDDIGVYLGLMLFNKDNKMDVGMISDVTPEGITHRENTPYFTASDDTDIRSMLVVDGQISMLVSPYPIYKQEQWLWESNGSIMKESKLRLGLLNIGESIMWKTPSALEIAYVPMARGICRSRIKNGDVIAEEISSEYFPVSRAKRSIRAIGGIIEKNGALVYSRLYMPYLYQDDAKLADLGKLKHVSAICESSKGFYVYDALEEAIYDVY